MTTRTKGHWPAGKRRHAPGPEWGRTLYRLRRRLARPARGRSSRRQLALALGVSERTVRRWLSGEDHPTPQHAAQTADWLHATR